MAELSIKEGRYLSCWDDVHQPVRRCRTSGLYSDDTQQALVLLWIWSQLRAKNIDPNQAESVADLFVKVCHRMSIEPINVPGAFGVHRGTGQNFREVILRGTVPNTAGLGGAMRIAPVATLIDDPMLVMPWAAAVTASTTTNPIGIAGAARIAAQAWNAARGEGWNPFNLDELGFTNLADDVQDAHYMLEQAERVLRNRGEQALLEYATKTGTASHDLKCAADGFALTGVPWIIHCVSEATSFEDALIRVCASGGDADTVAAIAGCLAALRFGRDAIPSWMVDGLVGREHVLDPNTWHPLASERHYPRMDRELQNGIEKQLREAAKARAGKSKPRPPSEDES